MELKEKRIAFLGDSITEGCGLTDRRDRYDNVMAREYGILPCNYGIGGTRIAYQRVPSLKPEYDLYMVGRAEKLDYKNADLFVLYGGVNDYLHGDAPIGEPTDTTPATFNGAIRCLLRSATQNHPDVLPVVVTPARCYFHNTPHTERSSYLCKLSDALPLRGYVDIMLKAAEEFGVPALNLYDALPIDPANEDDRAKYTVDGLHFNAAGHALLAKTIGEFLKSL